MVTYTAISPDNDAVTLACQSLDHALALATIDLHRGWLPVRINAGWQRLDIFRILLAVEERRARQRGAHAAGGV